MNKSTKSASCAISRDVLKNPASNSPLGTCHGFSFLGDSIGQRDSIGQKTSVRNAYLRGQSVKRSRKHVLHESKDVAQFRLRGDS
jgi:hypothetical protein